MSFMYITVPNVSDERSAFLVHVQDVTVSNGLTVLIEVFVVFLGP
jgi:hypothetical protein